MDSSQAVVGANAATAALSRTQKAALNLKAQTGGLGKSLRFLRGSFAAVGAAMTAIAFKNLIEGITVAENKLKLVTNTAEEASQAWDVLRGVSERSRTGLSDNVALFSRLSIATRTLGLSYQETADFTETLNKAMVVSGANAMEGKQALIQLGQGLASGRLAGDELRAVLEQLPLVADIIAKEFGVTRGEIRQLGEQGLLSADRIVLAMKKAAGDVDEAFAKTVPTIAQSFAMLMIPIEDLIHQIGKTEFAINKLISNSILFLKDHLQELGVFIGVAAGIITAKMIPALVRMAVAFALSPIGLFLIGVGLITAAIINFGNTMEDLGFGVVSGWDKMKAAMQTFIAVVQTVWGAVQAALSPIGKYLTDLWSDASDAPKEWSFSLMDVLRGAVSFVGGSMNNIVNFIVAAFFTAKARWMTLPVVFQGLMKLVELEVAKALNFIVGKFGKAFNFIIKGLNAMGGDFNPVNWDDAFNVKGIAAEGLVIAKKLTDVDKIISDGTADIMSRDVVNVAGALKGMDAMVADYEDNLTQIVTDNQAAAETANVMGNSFQDAAPKIEEAGDAAGKAAKKVKELKDAWKDGSIGDGIKHAMEELVKGYGTAAEAAAKITTTLFKGMEDALVEFVTTGKLDFKALADSIIADITRIIIQQAIMKPLMNSLMGGIGGGGGGGMFGNLLGGLFAEGGMSNQPVAVGAASASAFKSAPRFATGGVTNGMPAILHDNEAVIPLSRGRKVPVDLGGQKASNTFISNYQILANDPNEFRRSETQIRAREAQWQRSASKKIN